MLSRIFWVGIAGIALVTGMIIQDREWVFGWDDDSSAAIRTERAIDRSIDRAVDRAVDQSVDHMTVTGSDGRDIEVSREAKRALASAVGQLVQAEADLALIKIRDGSDEEMKAATVRRDEARAAVDRLKAQIERQDRATAGDGDAVSAQIERQVRDGVREDVRAAVRDAVRN